MFLFSIETSQTFLVSNSNGVNSNDEEQDIAGIYFGFQTPTE